MISEVSYVIAGFEEKFKAFKGKKIILHGSRDYARAIIERFDPFFHFAGVVSFDPIDAETFLGIPVFQQEEIPPIQPELIILTERVKYAEAAYCALRRMCKQNDIAIWNMYGLDEKQLHRDAEIPAPESLGEWQELCSTYDRVVFEVVDTLIHFPLTGEKPMVKKTLLSLCNWLRKQGKELGFSLRKSFPEEKQINTLKDFGLVMDAEAELIRRKGEDLSFRILRDSHPKEKIIYICNGLVNEFILPRCYGIDTRRVGERLDLICLVPEEGKTDHRPFSADRYQKIEVEIRNHSCISFDIFDTLLVRKVLYTRDVFCLTERRAIQAGFNVKGLAEARERAEKMCPYADIDTIYEYLEDWYDWDEETTRKIRNIELRVERDVLTPRSEVVDLLRYALREGKRVILTSDMYLPECVLKELLNQNGITGFDRILVSCDCKKAKQTGLYEELIAFCGEAKAILHMGDNVEADVVACEAVGIDSLLIPSALRLAREQGWAESIRSANTLMERCLVGMIIAQLFRNPFRNPNLHECPLEDRLWRYGTGAVGPLVSGYMTWLLDNLRGKGFDGVLFLARDGYLPITLYRKLQEKLRLPRPIYYYANRHAAFLCGADYEGKTTYIIDEGRHAGLSAKDVLKNIYHIAEEELLPQEHDETVMDYVDRHMPIIHQFAAKSREGYRQYSRHCGMQSGGQYAVVDFVAAGTTQMYLQSFLPYHMKGYYFGSYSLNNKGECDIEYYLQGNNNTFLNSFIEMEGYLTSPEPSQDYMKEEGTPVFFKETRTQQELKGFQLVFDTALKSAEEFFQLFYQEGEYVTPSVVEEMYDAEGYHWVQQKAYDDWLQVPIQTRGEVKNEN